MMKINKKSVLILCVIIVIGAAIFLGKTRMFAETKKADAEKTTNNAIAVEVQKSKSIEKTTGLEYKATIEPVDYGIVSSKISGKVAQVLFDNGKAVSKGDPLVILDDQDIKNQLRAAQNQLKAAQSQLAGAEANYHKLQTNLDMAQLNYSRTKALFEQDAAPQANLDSADAALKAAKADLEASSAAIESAKINMASTNISIDTLNDNLANTVIRAPMDGTVDEKNVYIGQYISIQGGSQMLAKVKNISSVNAVIQVEQSDLNSIRIGQKANVMLDQGAGETFEGVIKYIDTSANPAARVFNCKIEVVNKNQALRPGVFAKVSIHNDQKQKIIVLPVGALMGNEGDYSVYVDSNGTAEKRSVVVGEITKDAVEIKSGVQENESIICSNLNMLQDGTKINAAAVQGE